MNFVMSVSKARLAAAVVALPMWSLSALASPPVQSAAVDLPVARSTQWGLDVASVSVPYGDLNLTSPKGLATLNSRIRHAVSEVCDGQRSSGLSQMAAARECRNAASVDAMAQVALLTAPAPIVAVR